MVQKCPEEFPVLQAPSGHINDTQFLIFTCYILNHEFLLTFIRSFYYNIRMKVGEFFETKNA